MKLPTVKKVLPSRGQYLDLKAIHHLLGDIQHGRIGSLPVSLLYFQLEAFLKKTGAVFLQTEGKLVGCWLMTIDDGSESEEEREKVIVRSN